MRLKTATQTDACQEQLIRCGFKDTKRYSTIVELRLQDKPGEAYRAWFPSDGFRRDWFVKIYKGTAGPKNSIGSVDWDWDFSNTIKLRLV